MAVSGTAHHRPRRPRVSQSPEEMQMTAIRSWRLALALALAAAPAAWAGELYQLVGGVGSTTSHFAPAAAPVQTLKATPADTSEDTTLDVFYGRFGPYWRGYYHSSLGLAPRPLLYRPLAYPRYYFGFRRPF